jgi:hypothetical protein
MATNGKASTLLLLVQSVLTNALAGAVSVESGGSAPNNNPELGKDEIAWFFVEQYYTTLSKNPEKLHVGLQVSFATCVQR